MIPEEVSARSLSIRKRSFFSAVLFSLYVLASANVFVLIAAGQYDVRLGPLHLFAHGLFKPLQLVMAVFWTAFVARQQSGAEQPISARQLLIANVTALILAVIVHASFAAVNFQNSYWTHTEVSAKVHDLSSLKQLFLLPQEDGFYRPFTFISLLVDYRLFGHFWPAYHIQSILLHVANVVLLGYLARTLHCSSTVAALSSLFFAAAPFTFEAVLWPAARFDLWATLFTLLTLIATVRILRVPAVSYLKILGVGLLYLLALLNKESAYCIPLLIAFIILTRRVWGIKAISRRKTIPLAAVLISVTAGMLLVRFQLYGSLGGYSTPNGTSEHLHLSWRTVESTLTRLFAVAPFTANLSTGIGLVLGLGIVLLTLGYGSLLPTSGRDAVNVSLLGCALITILPAANIIGWIHDNAQQSRYLYTPGIWLALLFARSVSRSATIRTSLLTLALGSILVTWSNLSIYRDMLASTKTLADQVVREAKEAHACSIAVTDMPTEPNGIFFFRNELQIDIERRMGSGSVIFDHPPPGSCQAITLRWDDKTRTLQPLGDLSRIPSTL